MESSLTIQVRSTEIDFLGHVNNAKYLEYMEWGRIDWYEKLQLSVEACKRLGIGTVVVHISINYRKEVKMGEQLVIKTYPLRRGRTSFVLKQEIWKATGELAADAEVTSVAMDMTTRKSVPLPSQLAAGFS